MTWTVAPRDGGRSGALLPWLIACVLAAGCGGNGGQHGGGGAGGAGGKAGSPDPIGAGGSTGIAGGSASAGAGGGAAGSAGAVAGAGGDAAGSGGAAAGVGGAAGGASGAAGCRLAAGGADAGGAGAGGAASSVVLYSNDFETPNVPLAVNCGSSLDNRAINLLYGTPTFGFSQTFTVEGVVIHDPEGRYADPEGTGKSYAVGIQNKDQDDHMGLTLAVTGRSFLNVGFDLSSIDVSGCGGPFGVAAPAIQVALYDTPTGVFDFGSPGTLLDQGMVTGIAAPSPWAFAWKYGVLTLDATAVTGSAITVTFDLVQSGYAVIDNLSIVSSRAAGVVDRNNNGIPDDQEGCAP